jgi:predicted  nucleic acid-binding Zn-ribbon protein
MEDHWHYASDIHGGAEEHHRHYDLERDTERLSERLREDVRELREDLAKALDRIAALERQTPAALRSQRELDETLADNAAAGYGREGW